MKAMNEDTDKLDYTLVPPLALQEVARAFADGSGKYARDDWRRLTCNNRIAAALRHIEQFRLGHSIDGDSCVHHLGHAAADLMMAYELSRAKEALDAKS